MNRESNTYTIIYSVVMVILVALGLSFTHQSLLDKQIANENIDKMQQLLRTLNIEANVDEAQSAYNELITDAYLITNSGEKINGTDGKTPEDPAFSTELSDTTAQGLPVYEVSIEGKKVYILPMSGTGLWGSIWGYLAVEEDGSTIYGADFGHAGETPGLGAEIAERSFGLQFEGKELIKEGTFRSIAVVKPGHSDSRRDYIDGISGGTITSQGVDKMLLNSVRKYESFLMKLNS
ncbi:MAG: NADH:ubiquinone reductase (Na(+)-transporting) subunit C [Fermentimonas sp.]|jgi:Na+-transporting NADH:ubiquinone oxidoreductase subunit C|nr:NADH:ubiquinone reductase (Na(+)-transporting) subunit C [Fermentimonas sp.]